MIKINYKENTIFETTENVQFKVVEENVLHRTGKQVTGNFENITNVLIQHCPKDDETDFEICYEIAFAAVLVSVNMNVKCKIKKYGSKK
jgi:hypothetical protein